jgi:hypothetical protein
MFKPLEKLRRWKQLYHSSTIQNPLEIEAVRYFQKLLKSARLVDKRKVILVQTVEQIHYYYIFGLLSVSLKQKQNLNVEQFALSSLCLGESESLAKYIKLRLLRALTTRKWIKMYSTFCDNVGYKSACSSMPFHDLIDFFYAFKCWLSLKKKTVF